PSPSLLLALSLHDALPILADSLTRTARLLREDADYLESAAHAEYARLTAQATELEHAGGHAHTEGHAAAAELSCAPLAELPAALDRKSTRLNSSHVSTSYA